MRLIDADEFQKQIVGMTILNNYPLNKSNALCELVDNRRQRLMRIVLLMS